MSEWKEYKLKDIGCSFLSGFAFKSSDYSAMGVPLIKIGNIQNTLVSIDDDGDFVSEKLIDSKTEKYLLSDKDVLIAMTGQGSVGRVGRLRLRNNIKPLLNQRVGKFICDEKNINIDYLYFILTSTKYQDLLFNTGVGSGQPNLSPELILGVEIPYPNYKEQTAIAEVLSSLDDKIDLLHRQNKTLEQLAETLFRQWFVEEAGESRQETTFGELVKPKKGKNITKSEAIEGNFPVVAGGLEPSCYHNEPNTLEPVITISASGANAGFVRMYYTKVWASDCSYIDKTITPYLYFSYIFLKITQQILFDKQEGSAQPHIYPSHIMELETPKFSEELLSDYENAVEPIFQKIKSNTTQIKTLTQLRDTLLPKLMSGEARVKI